MASREIQLGNKMVGDKHPAFIVAEISGNHHQNYEEAVELVKAARDVGADAVKLQTYTPDTITLNSDKEWFIVKGKDRPESWGGQKLYDLYQTAHTPWEWQPKLKELADSLGILFFSSPFDSTAVDFLEDMGVLFYKIASYEAVHIPLLKKVAQTGKPVIMSIGFATLDEATLAIDALGNSGAKEIAVLHCVTAYSDKPRLENSNLKTIADIQERFGVVAGFSDNNAGIEIPVMAATIGGASVIEKHFILDRSKEGPDARFSIEPHEFKKMVQVIRKVEKQGLEALEGFISKEDRERAMGRVQYGPASKQEEDNKTFRPSIWAKKDVKKGEALTLENIRVARPGAGLAPRFFEQVLGKKAAQDIEKATPLSWDLIQESA